MDLLDLDIEELLLLKKLKQQHPEKLRALMDTSGPSLPRHRFSGKQGLHFEGPSDINDVEIPAKPRNVLPPSNRPNMSYDPQRECAENLMSLPYYKRLAMKLRTTRAIVCDRKVIYESAFASPNEGITLYVSKLPTDLTEQELGKIFEKYGINVTPKILTDSKTGKSKNVGFVKLENRSAADRAVRELNNTIPKGFSDPMYVKVAINRKRPADSNLNDNEEGHSIFVFNIHPETEDRSIWKLFGPFGAIMDVLIKRKPVTGECVGYGFVTMARYDDARNAIDLLNGFTLDTRVLQVSFKKNKNKLARTDEQD